MCTRFLRSLFFIYFYFFLIGETGSYLTVELSVGTFALESAVFLPRQALDRSLRLFGKASRVLCMSVCTLGQVKKS